MKHEDEEMKSSVYGFYESEHEYSNKTTTTKGMPNILQQKERIKKNARKFEMVVVQRPTNMI